MATSPRCRVLHRRPAHERKRMSTAEQIVDVEGFPVRLTTLDRVLWPNVGLTKADLIDYYARLGPTLLPYVAGRPLTLHRFPGGVGSPSFFQTRAPSHPSWIHVQRMHVFSSGKDVDAVIIDNLAGLIWAANLSTIELHPYLGYAHDLEHPTMLVFDLDPGAPATIVDACEVAVLVRDALAGVGLRSYPKGSGGVGIHVVVPLTSGHTYARTKAFARAVAGALTRADPGRITDLMPRQYRGGRVFIDWSQNNAGKSTVAPYSLRGGRIPTVAMPVSWDALERSVATRDHRPLVFSPADAMRAVAAHGDIHSLTLTDRQELPTEHSVHG